MIFAIATMAASCSSMLWAQVGPAAFYTVQPCRVLDTRNPDGPYGGPALGAGGTRVFRIGGQCGLPSTVLAVSATVIVTQPTAAGFLVLYPAGSQLPNVSTLNYRPQQTRANNAIIAPSPAGDLAITTGQGSGSVHVILDVNGYFELPPGQAVVDIETLKDPEAQKRMVNETQPLWIRRSALAYNPEVARLIALGRVSLPKLLDEFRRAPSLFDDTPLSLFAYALEQIGDASAVPVLTTWLEQNVTSELVWATDFVTHAIKVLGRQTGLNTTTYTYRIDEQLDTIAQARIGALQSDLEAPAQSDASSPAASVDTSMCPQNITVTGINASGQEEAFTFTYRTYVRDLQAIIDAQTDPQQKAFWQQQREDWRSADETAYGGSDYQVVPGATISQKSNCAGTVAENILNTIATLKGFPVRLGQGGSDTSKMLELASKFGSQVSYLQMDKTTVISHEVGGASAHVEVPVTSGSPNVVVHSKDNYGYLRQHTVNLPNAQSINFFAAPQARYSTRPWYLPGSNVTTRFYKVDPNRILSIVVDSSACLCTPGAAGTIPVSITEPTGTTTSERVITVAGTIGDPTVTSGILKINGSPQPIAVAGGAFSAQVVLRSGANSIRVDVTAPDGRRGCAENNITSTTPKTTISVTLTWNLDSTDVDLYVTQPDQETAWYSHLATAIGGRLDVDNTSGFGPENYYLGSGAGTTVLSGVYTVRVHYYSDHQRTSTTPARVVTWRVVVLLNEGTPNERRGIINGTLSQDNSGNSSPGSSGPDWATAIQITIP